MKDKLKKNDNNNNSAYDDIFIKKSIIKNKVNNSNRKQNYLRNTKTLNIKILLIIYIII